MSTQRKRFLAPLAIVFLVISIYWLFFKVPFYQYIFLFLGLTFGSFFLDLDHIVYWLFIEPNIEESRLARIAIFKYDINSIIKLIESTERAHTNLIFHHFFFQVILSLISIFAFTSSDNILGKSFLFSINVHLLLHEYFDYQTNKEYLQDWLFARESKQLPIAYLGRYIAVFASLCVLFFILLLRSAVWAS